MTVDTSQTSIRFRTSASERYAAALDFGSIRLPEARFMSTGVPDDATTQVLAEQIRCQFAPDAGRLAMTESFLESQGWPLTYRSLSLNAPTDRKSTIRSLLIARFTGGFSVVINEDHRPDNDEAAALIGHEIGHTLFFNHRPVQPRRISPGLPMDYGEEHEFCDRFAYALTGIPLRGC